MPPLQPPLHQPTRWDRPSPMVALALAACCALAGCTGLAASASRADCLAKRQHGVPAQTDETVGFHVILETPDQQRIDIRASQSCHLVGANEECRFSTSGSRPTPVWKNGSHPEPHRFTVKGHAFTLEFPDCKTAQAWRLPADPALPTSLDDARAAGSAWRDRMGSMAYRFVIRDAAGKALEGTPMSDHVMANHGFKVVWATIR